MKQKIYVRALEKFFKEYEGMFVFDEAKDLLRKMAQKADETRVAAVLRSKSVSEILLDFRKDIEESRGLDVRFYRDEYRAANLRALDQETTAAVDYQEAFFDFLFHFFGGSSAEHFRQLLQEK